MINNRNVLGTLLWDSLEEMATRPLALVQGASLYCYGVDFNKNVTEVFDAQGTIAAAYDYSPYGAVTGTGSLGQPVQWSGEMHDEELALAYYNYRFYNPKDGRWINRDPIAEQGGWNLYAFVRNNAIDKRDRNGLGFDLPIPHPEFPTSTSNSGIVWPNGEYTPPGIPPSAPLTPDDLASEFCRYSIPAPKCTCQNSSKVLDPYPDKARSICIDFLKKYQFSIAVISTALCLVNAEEQCQEISCCSERNNCRLKAHVTCYASRAFIPFLGFPEGGADIGWNMLLNDSQCD